MGQLYPEITPYQSDYLKVSDLHTIYFEVCGNPKGIPVVFLHGGPGGGVNEQYRRYFDPKKYKIILFDQRGCGRSTPFAELQDNTTWDLVEDINTLKNHLNIDKWAVFGGSWGSTLALSYAITYPQDCLKLFLRGIFLLRQKELHWFYQEGCNAIFPDAWEKYLAPIPENERDNLMAAYHKRLTGKNEQEKIACAKAWSVWEGTTCKLIPDQSYIDTTEDTDFALAFARIECHFFMNKGFFENENIIFENIDKIRHIPTIIVQGRYDVVCPTQTAWELHKAWPETELVIVDDAGHSLSENGITKALIKATDDFEL